MCFFYIKGRRLRTDAYEVELVYRNASNYSPTKSGQDKCKEDQSDSERFFGKIFEDGWLVPIHAKDVKINKKVYDRHGKYQGIRVV